MRWVSAGILAAALWVSHAHAAPVTIAIIIDDIGHHYQRGLDVIELPLQLTYSILPYTAHTSQLAKHARSSGKEIMLHLPMENLGDKPLGPGALHDGLTRDEFSSAIDKALLEVPLARGVNNHMGSALTQNTIYMNWLMEEIDIRDLFFVDSRTTHKTVALKAAHQRKVPSARRDVFLDNERNLFAIDQQFKILLSKARKNGSAIGIGHPYPETIEYLRLMAPGLEIQGIEVVPVSTLLSMQVQRVSIN